MKSFVNDSGYYWCYCCCFYCIFNIIEVWQWKSGLEGLGREGVQVGFEDYEISGRKRVQRRDIVYLDVKNLILK